MTPAIRAALRGQEPTPEQWAAISAPPRPVHVVAGAGSGKTAVMAARIAYLVEALGAPPASVLGLTFTNRAAAELQERVRAALAASTLPGAPGAGAAVTIDTYHAFAADIVRSYGVRIGIEPDADLLSEAQQYQLLLALLDEERFEHLAVRTPGGVIRKVLELASACADHLVPPAAVAEASRQLVERWRAGERIPDWQVTAARERTELARLVERYTEEKRRRGRLDFGDQVAKAVELVTTFPDIASSLQARFPYVLLDEYQDTNVAQRRLMQALCPPGACITAVGDARQAIYAFRGATMYNLLAFPQHFPGGPGEPLSLSVNFRSGRRILELANAVIEAIPQERRGGKPLEPLPASGDGEVRAALLTDQFAEAAFVADEVLRARERGLPDGTIPAWRDIAVLTRSRRLLGPLREALEERGVPVEVVGFSSLLEAPEIVDLVSTLRVIADPAANVALTRLLMGPRWRIGYRHLVRLARWAARHNRDLKEGLPGEDPEPGDVAFALSEALDHLDEVEGLDDEARARLRAFRDELRDLRAAADGPLLDLVETVLERTGVWAELEASSDRRAATARQNLAAFLDRVAAFAPVDGEPSLPAFLAYLDAIEDAAEPVEAMQPAQADSVKLMTVHMAKGLEFPMVVVAGLAAAEREDGFPRHGIFPDVRVDDPRRASGFPYELREDAVHLPRLDGGTRAFRTALEQRALEDERRLFYVAVTRAKQLLVLTAAWWYQGSERVARGPGPFWREAAEHPAVEVVCRADPPATSPLAARLGARIAWPPSARRPGDREDPLFPEGLAAAVALERARPGTLAARVPPGEEGAFEAHLRAQQDLAAGARAPARAAPPQPPRVLSITQVLEYARCPRAFYWSVVRPLPAPPRAAARLGTVVHRLLERRARTLPDLVDLADPAPAEPAAPPSLVERARRNFAATRFARLAPPEAEVGVALRVGGWVLRGRIDAVFRHEGEVELVDWKTSRDVPDAGGLDQLALYALALRELGELPPHGCRVTYCYLGGDAPREDSRFLGPTELDQQRALLEATLADLARGAYDRACGLPGCPACGHRG